MVGKIQENLFGRFFFPKDLGFGNFSFKNLGSNDPTQFTSTPTNLTFKEAEHKKQQHLEVGTFPGFWMVFWDTWALSRIPEMVVRKHGRLCVASRFVPSDQAKIIRVILVLADATFSRFVMMSPMFSADHRKVD